VRFREKPLVPRGSAIPAGLVVPSAARAPPPADGRADVGCAATPIRSVELFGSDAVAVPAADGATTPASAECAAGPTAGPAPGGTAPGGGANSGNAATMAAHSVRYC
jgi:hypothetical protein